MKKLIMLSVCLCLSFFMAPTSFASHTMSYGCGCQTKCSGYYQADRCCRGETHRHWVYNTACDSCYDDSMSDYAGNECIVYRGFDAYYGRINRSGNCVVRCDGVQREFRNFVVYLR